MSIFAVVTVVIDVFYIDPWNQDASDKRLRIVEALKSDSEYIDYWKFLKSREAMNDSDFSSVRNYADLYSYFLGTKERAETLVNDDADTNMPATNEPDDSMNLRGVEPMLNEDKPHNPIRVLGIMTITLESIHEYYDWSRSQAKAAFILAVFMCMIGAVFIGVSVVLTILYGYSTQATVLPAVGGMITELIAATALVIYKGSVQQLNHYHKALHEDQRYLSSIELVNSFSNETAKDDVLREIIRSGLSMNRVDRMIDDNEGVQQ